jgi:hypothetical protein
MALTKVLTGGIKADAVDNTILKLDDNFAFTGTVSGAGDTSDFVKLYQNTWTSAVSQVLINSVFSTTYDHYKVVGSVEISTNGICRLYMTSGGDSPSDATNTGVYMGEGGNRAAAVDYVGATANANNAYMTFPNNNNIYGNAVCSFQIELHDMYAGIIKGVTNVAAARERHFSFNCSEQNVASSDNFQHWGGGRFWNADSSHMPIVTGLKFAPSAGSFTEGNIAVYGYRK